MKAILANQKKKITGAASSIEESDLTAGMVLVSDSDGKVAASDVTSTELGYLDGVTSSVQTQIRNARNIGNAAQTTADDARDTADSALTLAEAALLRAGGTMTGSLILSGDPTEDLEAATKQYVDENAYYVTGSYTGNSESGGGGSQTIELGFRPKVVIIEGGNSSYYTYVNYYGFSITMFDFHIGYTNTSDTKNYSTILTINDNGFTVVGQTQTDYYPEINQNTHVYGYIAFS